MAIICDFRECQKVLGASEQRAMTVDSKRYTICDKCYGNFKEYLAMYLFDPVPIVEVPQIIVPRQIAQISGDTSFRPNGGTMGNFTNVMSREATAFRIASNGYHYSGG